MYLIKGNLRILSLIIFLAASLQSQEWYQTYNGGSNSEDRGYGIVVDSDGNIITTGYTTSVSTGMDIVALKYSNNGTLLWSKIFTGTGNYADRPFGIVVDNTNNIIICGYTTRDNGNIDYLTVKYNSSGIFQWAKTFNGTANSEDKAFGIVVDQSDNIFVTGTSTSSASGEDITTIKYSKTGSEIWVKTYDAPKHKNDGARKIAIDQDNNLYIAGYGEYNSNNSDFILLKYSVSGTLQWSKNYNGVSEGKDEAWGIVIDQDKKVYITGESDNSQSNTDIVTIKYNSSGSVLWTTRFDGPHHKDDKPYGIVVDDFHDAIFITGITGTLQNGKDFVTMRLNTSNGELKWSRNYNGPGNNDDIAYTIALSHNSENRHLFVAGTIRNGNNEASEDIIVISYSNTGTMLNTAVYGGETNQSDGAFGIAVDESDNYYLAGYIGVEPNSDALFSCDLITVKYKKLYLTGIVNTLTTPKNFYLLQNYPNPFNPSTTISFGLPKSSNVKISVYDVTGKLVADAVNSNFTKGNYKINFNGDFLSSGIYFFSIIADGFYETKKMLLIK
ncbi:MAG: SBBP repeat-containing protein [Ignavibacteria bacterium]|nr:SBBP repeat-containing protein [Ignavibacteria bacterium]